MVTVTPIMGGVLIIAIVIVYYIFRGGIAVPAAPVTVSGPFDLSVANTIVAQADSATLYAMTDSSFQAFVYLNPIMKTGAHVDCGTGQNQPSCADGVFKPCACDPTTTSCATCAHGGYVPLINICGVVVLEIMPAPDAGRQNQFMAQLTVKTQTTGTSAAKTVNQVYIETIPLPAISFQKWTMVTIARQGRRFDIYYNDQLIASQKTMYMPVGSSLINGNGVMSGAQGLIGQLANATVYAKRVSIQDVSTAYSTLADTRGSPYIKQGVTISIKQMPGSIPAPSAIGVTPTFITSMFPDFSKFSFNACLTGSCFSAPSVQASNGMFAWTSNYG